MHRRMFQEDRTAVSSWKTECPVTKKYLEETTNNPAASTAKRNRELQNDEKFFKPKKKILFQFLDK